MIVFPLALVGVVHVVCVLAGAFDLVVDILTDVLGTISPLEFSTPVLKRMIKISFINPTVRPRFCTLALLFIFYPASSVLVVIVAGEVTLSLHHVLFKVSFIHISVV